ncbi:MAG: ankyrin repeat domain-containing protein [Magnetospiraceae bacterium]
MIGGLADPDVRSAIRQGDGAAVKAWVRQHKGRKRFSRLLIHAAGCPKAGPEILDCLVKAGADPNFTEMVEEFTIGPALATAAQEGSLATVLWLLDHGADIAYQTREGYSALVHAAYNRSEEGAAILDALIARGADLNLQTQYAESPLSIAAWSGRFSLIRQLLAAGADPAPLRWDALMRAVALGTAAECKAVLDGGAPRDGRDRWERTPFLLAAQTGDVDKAALLLKAGADPEAVSRLGHTALMEAVALNQAALAHWLLQRGASLDSPLSTAPTPLMIAAENGAVDCVHVLLNHGADPAAEGPYGGDAMTHASTIEVVRALHAAGADLDRVGSDGYNALKSAVEAGNEGLVRALLDLGADPNRASTGEGPLHAAVGLDQGTLVDLLLAHGADPNQQDVDGWTPMHGVQSAAVAQSLLDHGGDPTILDAVSQSPWNYARSEDIRKVMETAIEARKT